jgi:hypothetical protein
MSTWREPPRDGYLVADLWDGGWADTAGAYSMRWVVRKGLNSNADDIAQGVLDLLNVQYC